MVNCISEQTASRLKKAAREGKLDIKNLYDMSSAERRAFFVQYSDEKIGRFLNAQFEKALIARDPTAALKGWLKDSFSPKDRTKPKYKSLLDKIETMHDQGLLTPDSEGAILEDLVSEKLGVYVGLEEVQKIDKMAAKVRSAREALGDDVGNPVKYQENVRYFEEKAKLDKYLLSRVPGSKIKLAVGTVGRGMMLAGPKTIFLNIGSNIEIGLSEAVMRRISGHTAKGPNTNLAWKYVKMANEIYKKTDYDISRMRRITDTGASGARVLGGDIVHSQGPGAFRAFARKVERIVFHWGLGAPDAAFSSVHFADSVGLNARQLAKGDKAKATKIMEDAMRIAPLTAQGEAVRQQGILDAEVATWTDSSWASKFSLGVRKVINDLTGKMRLGDFLFPFVKTPANVIATGMDYGGVGVLKALYKTAKFMRADKSVMTELDVRNTIRAISKDLTRAGLGQLGALIITSWLDDDDFMGAYDPARRQIEQLRNSNTNSIRIGGYWISLEWFGPLGVPIAGHMYARKYSDQPAEAMYEYSKGVWSQMGRLPAVEGVLDFSRDIQYESDMTFNEMVGETGDWVTSQMAARTVPAIVGDIAKALDPYKRDTNKNALKAVMARFPFLREKLDIKRDIFGEPIEGSHWLIDILFGARVKPDKSGDKLISELTDASNDKLVSELYYASIDAGEIVSFTDWDRTSSKRINQFKTRLIEEFGEKEGLRVFVKAKLEYGERLKEELMAVVEQDYYKKATAEEKVEAFEAQDDQAIAYVFKKHNFKYNSDWKPKEEKK